MHHESPPPARVTPQEMRAVLAGFPTGIALVAAEVGGRIVGLSANSFTSVSLDPPLVSISFAHTSTSWPALRDAPIWGVSILGEDQVQVLQELRRPAQERFRLLDMRVESGAAFVDGALAQLTVTLDTEVDAGDHALTLLRVLALRRDGAQHPLVFFGSGAHRLAR